MFVEAGEQVPVSGPYYVAACHHDQVYRRQIVALESEAFAYETFYPIAPGGVPNAFLGQREPEARVTGGIVPVQDGEPTVSGTATAGEHRVELRSGEKSVRALEPGSAH